MSLKECGGTTEEKRQNKMKSESNPKPEGLFVGRLVGEGKRPFKTVVSPWQYPQELKNAH